MIRPSISPDYAVHKLREAVIAELDANPGLANCSVASLRFLQVSTLPSLGPRENGANWTYRCPDAPPALKAALDRHALRMQAEFDVLDQHRCTPPG